MMGGWMDGWVGYDILPPSIFIIFKYDYTQHELLADSKNSLKSCMYFLIGAKDDGKMTWGGGGSKSAF